MTAMEMTAGLFIDVMLIGDGGALQATDQNFCKKFLTVLRVRAILDARRRDSMIPMSSGTPRGLRSARCLAESPPMGRVISATELQGKRTVALARSLVGKYLVRRFADGRED